MKLVTTVAYILLIVAVTLWFLWGGVVARDMDPAMPGGQRSMIIADPATGEASEARLAAYMLQGRATVRLTAPYCSWAEVKVYSIWDAGAVMGEARAGPGETRVIEMHIDKPGIYTVTVRAIDAKPSCSQPRPGSAAIFWSSSREEELRMALLTLASIATLAALLLGLWGARSWQS